MNAEMSLPLAGITVFELGHTIMGPTCGMILANMGSFTLNLM